MSAALLFLSSNPPVTNAIIRALTTTSIVSQTSSFLSYVDHVFGHVTTVPTLHASQDEIPLDAIHPLMVRWLYLCCNVTCVVISALGTTGFLSGRVKRLLHFSQSRHADHLPFTGK